MNSFFQLFSSSEGELVFAAPWMLTFPLLFLFVPLLRGRQSSPLLHPDTAGLSSIKRSLRLRLRGPCLFILTFLTLILLSLAAARPQKVSISTAEVEGAALMLAIDASKSMLADDFESGGRRIDRLEAVKLVVNEFIEARTDDRIGLVVFGQNAALAAPLTYDHQMLKEMLKSLRPGVLGDATAIGDGLGTALRHMQNTKAESKALILLTDGVSNAGLVNPIKAADIAKDLGVKVHTIGIGSSEAVNLSAQSFFFNALRGAPEFDEETLRRIAQMTGGVYFNAASLDGLKDVYRQIDRLERIKEERDSQKQLSELFYPFALAAFVTMLLHLSLASLVFPKVP